jgi:hypothetical protein
MDLALMDLDLLIWIYGSGYLDLLICDKSGCMVLDLMDLDLIDLDLMDLDLMDLDPMDLDLMDLDTWIWIYGSGAMDLELRIYGSGLDLDL